MEADREGVSSWDRLDNVGRPIADRIHPTSKRLGPLARAPAYAASRGKREAEITSSTATPWQLIHCVSNRPGRPRNPAAADNLDIPGHYERVPWERRTQSGCAPGRPGSVENCRQGPVRGSHHDDQRDGFADPPEDQDERPLRESCCRMPVFDPRANRRRRR
jgi:hypothetical protein